jgi:hypothetical protein
MDLGVGEEEPILDILKTTYPEAAISLKSSKAQHLEVAGRPLLPLADLENDGVWEDTDYIDEFIVQSNCLDLPSDRVVRILSAKFESPSGSSVLVVASNDFRLIFDDIDLWFVQTCAGIIHRPDTSASFMRPSKPRTSSSADSRTSFGHQSMAFSAALSS